MAAESVFCESVFAGIYPILPQQAFPVGWDYAGLQMGRDASPGMRWSRLPPELLVLARRCRIGQINIKQTFEQPTLW
jgi:hypothetical protein